jgi:hypothetical protein
MALQNLTDTAALPRRERRAAGGGLLAAPAQVISHVGSPPVLSAACVLAIALQDGRPTAFVAAVVFTLVGSVLPLLALRRLWRRGQIADIELTRRDQRLWPLLLTTTCLGMGAGILQLFGAPPAVTGVASILGVLSLLLLAVTTRWKVSVHSATAAAAAALLWCLTARLESGLALLAAVVWSRLYLRRHTAWQCLAGSLAGAGLMLVFWPLLGG